MKNKAECVQLLRGSECDSGLLLKGQVQIASQKQLNSLGQTYSNANGSSEQERDFFKITRVTCYGGHENVPLRSPTIEALLVDGPSCCPFGSTTTLMPSHAYPEMLPATLATALRLIPMRCRSPPRIPLRITLSQDSP